MSGVKFDQGKATFDLVPFDALAAVHRVMVFGAGKYGARNWERGMGWLRLWNACLRHLFAWVAGEDRDPETGESHLAHAACCILFLLAYVTRQAGTDDRTPPLAIEAPREAA